MTRDDLIREFRVLTLDRVEPYLFETAWVMRWLTEAQAEACVRARLLPESSDPAVCELDVAPGETSLPLHPALYEISHLAFRPQGATRREPLKLVSVEWLDDSAPEWRDRSGTPRYAVQSDTALRLVPAPSEAGVVLLEGYRLPLGDALEIHAAHHRHLLEWVLYRAYSLPDSDLLDLKKAAQAEAAFVHYFGPRPDADLRRASRQELDHHNKAWI